MMKEAVASLGGSVAAERNLRAADDRWLSQRENKTSVHYRSKKPDVKTSG